MIGYLVGTLLHREGSIITIGTQTGVGYDVFYEGHNQEVEPAFWIWSVFREDAGYTLFGFDTRQDKQLAILLWGVDGIGPASAARLVQHQGYDVVTDAIRGGDAKYLSSLAKGLGPKKAKDILEKLGPKFTGQASGAGAKISPETVLTQMGLVVDRALLVQVVQEQPKAAPADIVQAYIAKLSS
jgi:Holliday junction resolvasome RuvABC DNA-binding subunit